MKKKWSWFINKYNASPAFAGLVVTLALALLFQTARVFVGHNDNEITKLMKIGTALLFMLWVKIYLKVKNRVT